jgi:AraC-like DNA-binding protein
MAVTGNKKELARALHVSVPTLDRWLERFGEAVPMLKRGSNGRGYEFDIPVAVQFFAERKAEEAARAAERDEALAQLDLPLLDDTPNVSQRDIGLALDNEGKRQKLAISRGIYTPAAEIRAALSIILAGFHPRLESIVRRVCAEHHMPETVEHALLGSFSDATDDLCTDLQKLLPADDATS